MNADELLSRPTKVDVLTDKFNELHSYLADKYAYDVTFPRWEK